MLSADFSNSMLDHWQQWMWAVTWQSVVVFVLVLLSDRLLRRFAWPQLRLAFWSLFVLKFLIPPSLTSPVSLAAVLNQHELAPLVFLNEGVQLQESSALWAAIAFGIWLGGVVVLSIGYFCQHQRVAAIARGALSDSASNDRVHVIFRELLEAQKLRKQPRLRIVESVSSPAVWGVRRPVILLPRALVETLSEDEIRLVLLHELMHVKRGDRAYQALLTILQIVYWFNPLLYFARLRMNRLQELGCDASVVEQLNDQSKPQYRETLIRTAQHLLGRRPGVGVCSSSLGAGLVDRLDALNRDSRGSLSYGPCVAVLMVMIKVFVFPMGSPGGEPSLEETRQSTSFNVALSTNDTALSARSITQFNREIVRVEKNHVTSARC